MAQKISDSNQKLLIYAGVGLGVYFLLLKPILVKLGIRKSQAELQKEADEKKRLADEQERLRRSGVQLSQSKTYWDGVANTIYNSMRYAYFDDDYDVTLSQLLKVRNEADILYLIETFGKRQEYIFGLDSGSPKDLPTFVNDDLSDSYIKKINADYTRKGIKFQF